MDGRIVYLTTSLYLYSIPTLPITSIGTPSIPIYLSIQVLLLRIEQYTLVLIGSCSIGIQGSIVGIDANFLYIPTMDTILQAPNPLYYPSILECTHLSIQTIGEQCTVRQEGIQGKGCQQGMVSMEVLIEPLETKPLYHPEYQRTIPGSTAGDSGLQGCRVSGRSQGLYLYIQYISVQCCNFTGTIPS